MASNGQFLADLADRFMERKGGSAVRPSFRGKHGVNKALSDL